MNDTKNILEANKRWNEADSNTIADNIERILTSHGYKTFVSRTQKLMEITNSSKYAVYAWLNRGRTNVKVPFLKLCMIADAFDVSINELLDKDLGG